MIDEKTIYFSTGEFAKLCRVNKKTLFYYNDIGILCPEKIADNGYRYYSHNQLELLSVISTLQDTGMSLKSIKELIDRRNSQNITEVLKYEVENLEKEIKRLKRIRDGVKNRIASIEEGRTRAGNFEISYQPEEYLILSDSIDNSADIYDVDTYTAHITYCKEENLDEGYPVGVILEKDKLLKGAFNKYSCYYTKVRKGVKSGRLFVKPEGTYLVYYARGYYDKLPLHYERIMQYIAENHLTVKGNSYEQGLIDEVAAKDTGEYVIRISIEINEG